MVPLDQLARGVFPRADLRDDKEKESRFVLSSVVRSSPATLVGAFMILMTQLQGGSSFVEKVVVEEGISEFLETSSKMTHDSWSLKPSSFSGFQDFLRKQSRWFCTEHFFLVLRTRLLPAWETPTQAETSQEEWVSRTMFGCWSTNRGQSPIRKVCRCGVVLL